MVSFLERNIGLGQKSVEIWKVWDVIMVIVSEQKLKYQQARRGKENLQQVESRSFSSQEHPGEAHNSVLVC